MMRDKGEEEEHSDDEHEEGEDEDDTQIQHDCNVCLMVKEENVGVNVDNSPLHDMTCVGIDTCSAKSISCIKADFFSLQLLGGGNVSYELRGVGGISKTAGKGVMVLYAKDINDKIKAII
jgi:hypothetical protein